MSFVSGGGSGDRRPGIFDSFRGAFAPQQLPADDGTPIVAPRSILIAAALSLVAGVLMAFLAVMSIVQFDSQFDLTVQTYQDEVASCTAQYDTVGSSITVPEGGTDEEKSRAQLCQSLQNYTDADFAGFRDTARTQSFVIGGVILVAGLAAIAAGWFLRTGAAWARRVLIGVVVLTLGAIMFLSIQNIFLLGASLLLVVAVMLSFVGGGGLFFARHRARRAAS